MNCLKFANQNWKFKIKCCLVFVGEVRAGQVHQPSQLHYLNNLSKFQISEKEKKRNVRKLVLHFTWDFGWRQCLSDPKNFPRKKNHSWFRLIFNSERDTQLTHLENLFLWPRQKWNQMNNLLQLPSGLQH